MRDKETSCQGDQTQHCPCSVGSPVGWPHQDDLGSLKEIPWSSCSQPTETPYGGLALSFHGDHGTTTLGATSWLSCNSFVGSWRHPSPGD